MVRPAILAVMLLALAPARADEGPSRTTTDNAEYCEALAARLAASPAPVGDAPRELGEEGRRLCASGHVRTGIAKLRRALRATRAELRSE
jgi:hypothetical protein